MLAIFDMRQFLQNCYYIGRGHSIFNVQPDQIDLRQEFYSRKYNDA